MTLVREWIGPRQRCVVSGVRWLTRLTLNGEVMLKLWTFVVIRPRTMVLLGPDPIVQAIRLGKFVRKCCVWLRRMAGVNITIGPLGCTVWTTLVGPLYMAPVRRFLASFTFSFPRWWSVCLM